MSGFIQDTDLDSHLIFDNYSYFIPMTKGDADTTPSVYAKLYNSGDFFFELGVTDFLFSPPFKTNENDTYNDGYNIADRYDVGEFFQYGMTRTKYGTKSELKNCIRNFKISGINSVCNVNCNSVMFQEPTVIEASACDSTGSTKNITDPNFLNFLYYCNAGGGGLGQVKYGTFQKWVNSQFNGTQPQGYGLYRIMVDQKLIPYFYLPDNKNTSSTNNTNVNPTLVKTIPANNLPSWINLDNGDVPYTRNGYFVITDYYTTKYGVKVNYADVYSDPRNGVISQSWSAYKIINGATALIDDWVNQQPGYSSTSEGDYDYFVFVVQGTQVVNVSSKTTWVKYPYGQNCISGEFYKGLDVNNTDTTVQAETINWIKWILNLGFNGVMLEAADHYNYNLLIKISNYMNSITGKNNNNLQLVKNSDSTDMAEFQLLYNSSSQLFCDSDQINNLGPLLNPLTNSSPLTNIFTGSTCWNQRSGADVSNLPNWSYLNNCDTELNLLSLIPTPTKLIKSDTFTINVAKLQLLDNDRHITKKLYAPYNEIICYALMLTNTKTVPSVFYGDMWRSDAAYLSTKTCYYQYISHILKLRTRYAYGGQNIIFHISSTRGVAGHDLISSTRFGLNSETGMVTVISNNPNIECEITVYVGTQHANQTYMNMFSLEKETAVVNNSGYMTILIVGIQSYYVYGHLSMWVPVIDPSVYEGGI